MSEIHGGNASGLTLTTASAAAGASGAAATPSTPSLAGASTSMRTSSLFFQERIRSLRGEASIRMESSFSGAAQEDIFFQLKHGESSYISKTDFIKALSATGLLPDDPRLRDCMKLLSQTHEFIDFQTFKKCISPNVLIIDKAFHDELVITEFKSFCMDIKQIYDQVRVIKEGKVADYIPQLSRVNPDFFGVSICTVDGQRYSIGDSQIEFCLQSTCMPINYILALEEHGEDKVHEHVGREPSGRGFNSLTLNETGHPHNPLINAGAIMINSMIQAGAELSDRFDYVVKMYRRMAGGRRVGFSNSTYLSERQTADRNFALAHYMKEKNAFPKDTDLLETLEFYFQLCSVEMTTESLSVLAGTLANGGVCPITGEAVVSADAVKDSLSVMYSCGLYDYSGEFSFTIGLPAKSGVAGALVLVVPNVMGIVIWSPPLDRHGNSVRGIEFSRRLVERFNFHNYDNLVHVDSLGKKDPRADVSTNDNNLLVILLFAASEGDLTTLKRLYMSGFKLDAADYDGRTALHLAASQGHVHAVEFLLTCGQVDINLTDRWGGTALDDAIRENQPAVVTLLKRLGAAPSQSTK